MECTKTAVIETLLTVAEVIRPINELGPQFCTRSRASQELPLTPPCGLIRTPKNGVRRVFLGSKVDAMIRANALAGCTTNMRMVATALRLSVCSMRNRTSLFTVPARSERCGRRRLCLPRFVQAAARV